MLKVVICCVMIAATAAVAWEHLEDVPDTLDVRVGTHITWGYNRVWGMFPTPDPEWPETYVAYYYPDSTILTWVTLDEPMEDEALVNTGLTFRWQGGNALFAVGAIDDGEELDSYLYWYSLLDHSWSDEDIDDEEEFTLEEGACIAYAPNSGYHPWNFAVPGWIYCLPGAGKSFWRYHIPAESLPDIALYGYYPGPGAVIADRTPPFQWGSVATPTYRLLVSTNSLFSDTVIDEQVSIPEYEPEADLDNGTYYWRTAAWVSSAWSWSGTRNFVLEGGWEQLDSIPTPVGEGAAMAYDGSVLSHPALLVLVGDEGRGFYEYNLQQPGWNALPSAPDSVSEDAGTSITTHDPVIGWTYLFPMVAFGSQVAGDNPYYFKPDYPYWFEWNQDSADPYYDSHFPEPIRPDASMILGSDHNMYMVVGNNNFYWVEPDVQTLCGQQARAVRPRKTPAHTVACGDGIEVEYQLPASARVRATLHNVVGRQVAALDAGELKPGTHRLSLTRDSQGRKLNAGAYFVLLDMGTEQAKLKAVVR